MLQEMSERLHKEQMDYLIAHDKFELKSWRRSFVDSGRFDLALIIGGLLFLAYLMPSLVFCFVAIFGICCLIMR